MTVPINTLTDLWNAIGTTFTAIKMDVTNTASAAGSKLMDLLVGGSSKFSVAKDGSVKTSNDVDPTSPGEVIYFPGEPGQATIPVEYGLAVNRTVAGLGDDVFIAPVAVYETVNVTGGDNQYWGYTLESVISEDSTGNIGTVAGSFVHIENNGEGDIASLCAYQARVYNQGPGTVQELKGYSIELYNNPGGIGDVNEIRAVELGPYAHPDASRVENVYAIYIQGETWAYSPQHADNVYGISIHKQSLTPGAAGRAYNIRSWGADSLNVFEGHCEVGEYIQFAEMAAPAAPAADNARLFTRDNGAGKTQLCVIFPTGAIQVISTEP